MINTGATTNAGGMECLTLLFTLTFALPWEESALFAPPLRQ
ncbi:MAG TPA: hypothetical protein VIL01_12730 [Thermomicrobiales bacterium]